MKAINCENARERKQVNKNADCQAYENKNKCLKLRSKHNKTCHAYQDLQVVETVRVFAKITKSCEVLCKKRNK